MQGKADSGDENPFHHGGGFLEGPGNQPFAAEDGLHRHHSSTISFCPKPGDGTGLYTGHAGKQREQGKNPFIGLTTIA